MEENAVFRLVHLRRRGGTKPREAMVLGVSPAFLVFALVCCWPVFFVAVLLQALIPRARLERVAPHLSFFDRLLYRDMADLLQSGVDPATAVRGLWGARCASGPRSTRLAIATATLLAAYGFIFVFDSNMPWVRNRPPWPTLLAGETNPFQVESLIYVGRLVVCTLGVGGAISIVASAFGEWPALAALRLGLTTRLDEIRAPFKFVKRFGVLIVVVVVFYFVEPLRDLFGDFLGWLLGCAVDFFSAHPIPPFFRSFRFWIPAAPFLGAGLAAAEVLRARRRRDANFEKAVEAMAGLFEEARNLYFERPPGK